MAGYVNKAILIGNLGRDPEIHATQDGRNIATLRIATGESWKDKQTGERREKVEWHNVVIFNEALCKVVKQYLKKGSRVYIEGQIRTRKWQDKNGQDRYSTEIHLNGFGSQLVLLGDPRGAAAGEPSDANAPLQDTGGKEGATAGAESALLDDPIPF